MLLINKAIKKRETANQLAQGIPLSRGRPAPAGSRALKELRRCYWYKTRRGNYGYFESLITTPSPSNCASALLQALALGSISSAGPLFHLVRTRAGEEQTQSRLPICCFSKQRFVEHALHPSSPCTGMGANTSYGPQWSLPGWQEGTELQQCRLISRAPSEKITTKKPRTNKL